MLEFCERLAAWLRPHAWLVNLLGVAAALALPAAIFFVSGPVGQALSLAAITLLLWALTLGAFIRAFAVPLPRPDAGAGLLTRLRARLARLYRWCLAALIGALLVLVAWFSLRAAMLIDREGSARAVPPQTGGPAALRRQADGNTRIP